LYLLLIICLYFITLNIQTMKLRLRLLQVIFACILFCEISAQDLYTGVWRAGSDGYYLYGGLTWNQLVSKWQTLASQNQRLIDVSTFVRNGQRLYNGVWRAGTDAYALYGGVEWAAFVAKWQELGAQNLRLIDIETYTSGGKRLYVGVWRGGTDGYYLYGGLNWNDFVAKWQQLGAQNQRLIDVASYLQGTTRLYIGVWRAGTDGYALLNGLNWTDFTAKWQELAAQNLRLINISSYLSGSTRVYLGVWRAGTDAYALWNGTDWESLTSKWAELGSSNLRLINLETYESGCDDACLNNVLMDDDPTKAGRSTYNYPVTATTLHCEGVPGSCPVPGAGDAVYYRWPNLQIGSNYYMRNSAVFSAKDKIFTLPFSDAASSMGHNGWLYEPGNWHHAIDYYRNDTKTFQIKAAAAGTVIFIGWDYWSGNTIVISHDVGRIKDAYRTIYMHLQNGPANDCNTAWTKTVPKLSGDQLTNYKTYLNGTGCPLTTSQRSPTVANWGKQSQKIQVAVGAQVTAGQLIAYAGSTGPGGCGCADDGTTNANTHLHIFFAHRDATDKLWYFFDPYGIYSYPSCYPTGVADPINTECARYPITWKTGNPSYPALSALSNEPVAEEITTTEKADIVSKLFISPNPSSGSISLKYYSIRAGKIDMVVYDKSGNAIFRKSDYAAAGNNGYNLNLSNLVGGSYYVELSNNNIKVREKFIISK
jgi:murein DD-endopeptidase MepM/ murein hydrolase activator NlpD